MGKCSTKRSCLGSRNRRIDIVRRRLIAPTSDSAEPTFGYITAFTVRAAIKTNGGVNEWSRVRVGDEDATHTFSIAYTSMEMDVRDRVRDGVGNLYKILKVENVNEQDDELKIHAARIGSENESVAA
jgi:hypothetical protein